MVLSGPEPEIAMGISFPLTLMVLLHEMEYAQVKAARSGSR